jgi:hypothetical protein
MVMYVIQVNHEAPHIIDVYLEKKGPEEQEMLANNIYHHSGLYDVWVYFPRTLISGDACAKPQGRDEGDLSDGYAHQSLRKDRSQIMYPQGSNRERSMAQIAAVDSFR